MIKIFSLDFEFKKLTCFAIIRVSRKTGNTEYHVRVMNSRLDSLLCGYNTFKEVNGKLINEMPADGSRELRFRTLIYQRLMHYLQSNLNNNLNLQTAFSL